MHGGSRSEFARLESARQEAWDRFVADYTSCKDKDPGDARRRYRREIRDMERR